MNWRIIGESLNSADQALYEGSDLAIDIYRSILTEQPVKDRQMQHYVFRRLALGYTAVGAHKEARQSFNSAFELSRTNNDFSRVFYDRGRSYMDRSLFMEAREQFRMALEAHEQENVDPSILQLIEERIGECEEAMAANDEWQIPVADRPGQSTSEILVEWEERSQNTAANE
ncbi:MAG TPA: hypothetical protein VFP32_01395 [Candidatus Saccharimonadales bacterium]|nr:hypothetical protein [Candidatus Saccharimonadales bacterium]